MSKKNDAKKKLKESTLEGMSARQLLQLIDGHVNKNDFIWEHVQSREQLLTEKDRELLLKVLIPLSNLKELRQDLMSVKGQFWKLDSDQFDIDDEESIDQSIERVLDAAKKDNLVFVLRQILDLY
jgi:septum formation topological specificity factor MinE